MTREEIKRKNEFEKNFNYLLKESVGKYDIKKKDYMLWTLKDDMIYSIFPNAYLRQSDLKPVMKILIEYKPMWTDDLLWEILGMKSNKKEPNSLRVVGAFTMIPATHMNKIIELQCDDMEYVRNVLYVEIEEFLNSLSLLNEEKYIMEIMNSQTVSDIDKSLIFIHQGKFEEARKLLKETSDTGRYVIGDKNYKKLVERYLNKIKFLKLFYRKNFD